MKWSRFLIPLLVMTSILTGVHHYVYVRVIRDALWPQAIQWASALLLTLLAISIPVLFISLRTLSRRFAKPFSFVVYTWMGILFYLFVLSAFTDAGKVIAALFGWQTSSPEAAAESGRSFALGIGSVALLLSGLGLLNVGRGFVVRRITVPISSWGEKPPMVIVQLSDIHVGPTVGRKFVARMVEEANALQPDLIAITGDLVDGTVDQLRDEVEPLRALKARYGVFFVTGNHEYYSGADAWISHLTSLGIRVLRNERVNIADTFDLAGVDDYRAANMLEGHGQDIEAALDGHDPSKPLVLLAHQPKAAAEAERHGVDLMLSGHVHGGQMVPFNWLTRLDQPLVKGLYTRGEGGKTRIYVSEGTGYWGPPMRIGTRCEITRIELTGSQNV